MKGSEAMILDKHEPQETELNEPSDLSRRRDEMSKASPGFDRERNPSTMECNRHCRTQSHQQRRHGESSLYTYIGSHEGSASDQNLEQPFAIGQPSYSDRSQLVVP